ncbi:hypothetical protein [Caniella muris]|uniref:hypothetical protein n=1 Tax=Caniella muris TaxID=2941502 RepID=UPI00203C02AF|nr:hypothetical protein [Caniella muris]
MGQRSWSAFVVVVGMLFVLASAAVAPQGTVDAPLLAGGLAVAAAGAGSMARGARRARTRARSGRAS